MSTAFTQEGLFSDSESLRVGVHWLKLAPSYFGLLRWLSDKESSCHTGGTGDSGKREIMDVDARNVSQRRMGPGLYL